MAPASAATVTRLLECVNEGDSAARDQLMAAVYDDLRGIARRCMDKRFGSRGDLTLQPTALVHESWMKLIRQRQKYDNRGQFFAIATKVIIRVLLDYARERQAAKRGGGQVRVPLDPDWGTPAKSQDDGPELSSLVGALEKLEALDSRKADVVKLRVLWGLTNDEVAKSLGIGRATVDRDWSFAKAWLKKEMMEGGDDQPAVSKAR
jgi:RNA polymerase sigma-70 factor, ECF subfamily